MILFYLYNLYSYSKLMLYYLILLSLNNHIYFLYIVLLLTFSIILIGFRIVSLRKPSLSNLRRQRLNSIEKYAIKHKVYHIWNIVILSSYITVFVCFIFYLRFVNRNKTLNIIEAYKDILSLFAENTYTNNIVILIIMSNLLIMLTFLVIRILNYVKLHFIQRHLYWLRNNQYAFNITWLIDKIDFKLYINVTVAMKIRDLYTDSFLHKVLNIEPYIFVRTFYLTKLLNFLVYKIHYFIFVIILFYDVCYNNFTLTKIFHFMPYMLIYDLFIRFSQMLSHLHIPSDVIIHKFLYDPIQLCDKKTAYFGDMLVDMQHFQIIYHRYIKKNFICDSETALQL